MDFKAFLMENKTGVLLALLVLVLGTSAYFIQPPAADRMGGGALAASPDGLRDIRIKVLSDEPGQFDLYAYASPNAMARYPTSQGKPIPETNGIVLGSYEAMMMKKEKVFSKTGDSIAEVPGINLTVAGVLAPTGLVMDNMHFVSEQVFNAMPGDANRVYVRFSSEGQPKLFYRFGVNESWPENWTLAKGSLLNYQMGKLGSQTYYPVVLGATEARMMRNEKLFTKSGDIVRGFFGTDVFIVGELNSTGTPLDSMHILPVGEKELG